MRIGTLTYQLNNKVFSSYCLKMTKTINPDLILVLELQTSPIQKGQDRNAVSFLITDAAL